MSQSEKPNPFAHPINVRRMLTTSPPKLTHVLPGLLAGTVGLLAAPGGLGKTTLNLHLAFAVASGEAICGGLFDDVQPDCKRTEEPGKVVFVAAEESSDLIANRLHAVARQVFSESSVFFEQEKRDQFLDLLDMNVRLHPMLGRRPTLLLDDEDNPTDSFHRLVEECAGARLVILDPLRQFHRGDENNSWAMTSFLQAAQHLAAKTSAAVLLAHHVNRASTNTGTGEMAGAARGSTAITDGVRWQLNLSRVGAELATQYGIEGGDESRYMRVDIAKANYLAPQPSWVLKRGAGGALSLLSKPTAGSVSKRGPRNAVAKYALKVAR